MTHLKKVTRYFKSRSTDQVYKCERHRNGNVSCFCPGFVYNGTCWHADKVANYKKVYVR